jgi:hypothetical protein
LQVVEVGVVAILARLVLEVVVVEDYLLLLIHCHWQLL